MKIVLRPYNEAVDNLALYAACAAAAAADNVDPLSSLEEIPLPDEIGEPSFLGADPDHNFRVAGLDGKLAGYSKVCWWDETDGRSLYLHTCVVHLKYRGMGVGTSLVRWAEARLREVAAGHPVRRGRWFLSNASSTQPLAHALLIAEGYRIEEGRNYGYLEMGMQIPPDVSPLPLPEGFEVRQLQPEHHKQLYASMKEAYSEEPDTYATVDEFDAWSAKIFSKQDLCFVAWAGDQIAGQVLCQIAKGRAEMAEVSIRKPWRRRGLARALMTTGLAELRRRGIGEVRLHTLKYNQYGSVALYEKVGFRALGEMRWYRKPMDDAGT